MANTKKRKLNELDADSDAIASKRINKSQRSTPKVVRPPSSKVSTSTSSDAYDQSGSDGEQSVSSFGGFSSESEEDNDEEEGSHAKQSTLNSGGFSSESEEAENEEEDNQETPNSATNEAQSFEELGIIPELCEATRKLNYHHPTPIQSAAIPHALRGSDIIGLAETGSGKTAAFGLPILQALMENPQPLFCVVLAPTRELAFQTAQVFEALGSVIAVKVVTLVGGMDCECRLSVFCLFVA